SCRRLIDDNPLDWRARLALAKHHGASRRDREALDVLFEAIPHNPHALAIHEQVWHSLSALGLEPSLVRRYVALTEEAVFYLDPASEVIVVDDGSSDQTWDVVRRLSQLEPRVRAIRLSRRFGKEAAICAGLMQVRGLAVVVMDSDLQHPPALIPQMYKAWRDEGCEVVEAVTTNRDSRRWSADRGGRVFYTLFRRLS